MLNNCGRRTMVDAVKKHSSAEVVMSLGVPTVLSDDTSGIAAAVEMAKGADEVILAVGTDLSWAHEEHDADNITFTAAQAQLISQVAEAAKKPVVVVTYTATPLDLTEVMANEKVGAILHVGQPSVTVVGVGELLFGKTSPAGRTVQTIYPVCRNGCDRDASACAWLSGASFVGQAEYADMVSIFDFNMRPVRTPSLAHSLCGRWILMAC